MRNWKKNNLKVRYVNQNKKIATGNRIWRLKRGNGKRSWKEEAEIGTEKRSIL